ncbi:ABC transporter substrate-binding protein [Metabacillus sp. GX 13764]|uniref:ABC transporter substrate-binding protein n=1 Tax=Metabacillus kandeliae TaxID=2900151 RepID=UPI001E4E7D07|nr:ABC transporter substrate-binding protein [Metabacillus kandeliae]MCD7032819.1 ABC transporter substrate-binding protein [Metabacillus kandeliae]
MKKLGVLLAVFALALSVLAGCSNSGNEAAEAKTKDGKTIINFWTFWGSETRRPVIEKIINDYNKSQDKVFVKHTFLPFGDIWTKNLAAVGAGNPADVVINDINTVAQRAKNGQTEDLSALIKDDPSFKDKFYPQLWNAVTYEHKPYGVPFNTDTRLLFYNKKAFKEAGLNPEAPPETWDDLKTYADKLDVKKGSSYDRIGFYPMWGSVGANSWMMFGDKGKGYFDENGKVMINTPEKVSSLNWVMDWQKRYGKKNVDAFKAEFGNETANPFISGKVAMWVDVATFYTQIRDYGKDMDFGVAPIPAKTANDQHYSEGGGFVAEVPKGAKHPKEAMDFIKYLTGAEAQSYWAAKNFDNVANKEATKKAADMLSGKDKMVYEEAEKSLQNTKMSPMPVDYPDYPNAVNPQIDQVILGAKKPADALKDAEKAVKALKQ